MYTVTDTLMKFVPVQYTVTRDKSCTLQCVNRALVDRRPFNGLFLVQPEGTEYSLGTASDNVVISYEYCMPDIEC